MPEETITITKKEYNDLRKDAWTLSALERGGVDNWEWYGDSISDFEEEFPFQEE